MGEQTQGQKAQPMIDVPERIRRAAVAGERLRFNSMKTCPACFGIRMAARITYCQEPCKVSIRPRQRFSAPEQIGQEADPHLHVACGHCGFEWLEEPAWKA